MGLQTKQKIKTKDDLKWSGRENGEWAISAAPKLSTKKWEKGRENKYKRRESKTTNVEAIKKEVWLV